jgi:hypothetical protein
MSVEKRLAGLASGALQHSEHFLDSHEVFRSVGGRLLRLLAKMVIERI